MKEHPILFSGEMVRAILDGRKTQTRRVMDTPPVRVEADSCPNVFIYNRDGTRLREWLVFDEDTSARIEFVRPAVDTVPTKALLRRTKRWQAQRHNHPQRWTADEAVGLCPYGHPYGWHDAPRLWVRETWAAFSTPSHEYGERDEREGPPSQMPDLYGTTRADVVYKADGKSYPSRWRPAIHMPRWASRLTLEIVSVRMERLQDITEADARAEGVDASAPWFPPGQWSPPDEDPRQVGYGRGNFALQNFRALWEHINGKRAPWQSNPWVWVVTFKPL